MNTPAASNASVRHEHPPAATSAAGSANGDGPANAFELLFGVGFALPQVDAAPPQAVQLEGEPLPPEFALADLSGWMQQLPFSPLPTGLDASATAQAPSALALLQGDPGSAPASTALEAMLQPVDALPAAGRSEVLAGPFLGSLAAGLAVQPRPTALGEVMTRALLQRTEFSAPMPATLNAPPTPMPQAPLEVALPPGSAPKLEQAFAEGMAVRLNWMAQQQAGRAEIQLHPAELGSIDVQIEFEGKSVKADFQSPVAEVRQLLESTLPRLRDLLEAQGLQLRHADVGSGEGQARGGREGSSGAPTAQHLAGGPTTQEETGLTRTPRLPGHDGTLSEYA